MVQAQRGSHREALQQVPHGQVQLGDGGGPRVCVLVLLYLGFGDVALGMSM